jgi:hypothetical protein
MKLECVFEGKRSRTQLATLNKMKLECVFKGKRSRTQLAIQSFDTPSFCEVVDAGNVASERSCSAILEHKLSVGLVVVLFDMVLVAVPSRAERPNPLRHDGCVEPAQYPPPRTTATWNERSSGRSTIAM